VDISDVFKRIIILAVTSVLITGCGSLIPKEQKQSLALRESGAIALKDQDTYKSVTADSTPSIPVSLKDVSTSGTNSPLTIVFNVPAVNQRKEVTSKLDQNSTGNTSAVGSKSSTIPLFVKIIGLSIGIVTFVLACMFAIRMLKNYMGKTVDAAFGFADNELSTLISNVEAQARGATDEGKKGILLSLLGDLQKARGKVGLKRSPKP